MINQAQIAAKVSELRDDFRTLGIAVPYSLKRRDPLEPGRKEKEELEDKIFALFMRQFRKQRAFIRDLLNRVDSTRKAIGDRKPEFYLGFLGDDFYTDTKLIAGVSKLLTTATEHGIELFGAASTVQIDYTLTNARAAKWVSKNSFELIKGMTRTTKKALRTIFKSFIDTPGMTIGNVIELLPFNEARSLMIATTEITRAYATAAQMAGEDLAEEFPEVRVIKRWWTNNDDRVCPICGPLHGTVVDVDQGFNSIVGSLVQPPAHVLCLTGDAFITASTGISAVSKRRYEGNLIIIRTASGNKLSITPNHPILTDRGWVAANLLNIGDYVISHRRDQWITFGVNNDYITMPTMIKEIADGFFSLPSTLSRHVPIAPKDFHGDGIGSKVAVIGTNSLLGDEFNIGIKQPFIYNWLDLGSTIKRPFFLKGFSSFDLFFNRNNSSFGSFMRRASLPISLLGRHLAPFEKLGFGSTARINPSFQQALSDSPAIDPIKFGECILGHSTDVFFDDIVDIQINSFRGHVYNLQTETGAYAANGIIAHNCRCWINTTTRIIEQ